MKTKVSWIWKSKAAEELGGSVALLNIEVKEWCQNTELMPFTWEEWKAKRKIPMKWYNAIKELLN